MRAVRAAGVVLRWIMVVVLSLLLIANLYTIAARHVTDELLPDVFGWSWAVVVSGSMEPEISVNDLILVREQDDYEVNDIISFESGSSVVTHRIIEKTDDGYVTKGDANNAEDKPIPADAVIGKVRTAIPHVGLVIGYLRTPMGMFCMVLIGLLLVEIPYLMDRFKKEKGGCG